MLSPGDFPGGRIAWAACGFISVSIAQEENAGMQSASKYRDIVVREILRDYCNRRF
jgi:hypothetical protein